VKSGNVFELLNLSETEEKISGVDGQSLILTYVPYTYDLSIDMDSLQLDTARLDLSTLQTTSLFDLHYVQAVCEQRRYFLHDGRRPCFETVRSAKRIAATRSGNDAAGKPENLLRDKI